MVQSFYPLINRPTRITKSSTTLIDNIYCNISNTMAAGLLHTNISNHKGIFVSIITPYSLKNMFWYLKEILAK